MVDIMATTSEFSNVKDDYEDGELPEDGEIQDDDDEPVPVQVHHNAPLPPITRSSPIRDASKSPTTNKSKEGASSPPVKKFIPRGYGDDIETSNRDRDVWPNKDAPANDFGYGGEDKDYRVEEEGYGDSDYRQGAPAGRRRRHSPTEDDYDPRAKRGAFGRQYRPFRKPKWATEHQICKFFREGYCRDGDACTYSHQAEDSLRKPELCRFYQQGFCKKGLTCLSLHGEFPCKAFHKGECTREPCQFSHQPLTEYTQPMFDRMIQHEEDMGMGGRPAPHYPPPAGPGMMPPPPRRRVLLPGGPIPPHMPPAIHAPLPPHPPNSNGQLPPPAVVVPTLASSQASQSPHAHSHYPMPPQMPPRMGFFPPPPVRSVDSPRQEEPAPSQPPPAQFDITQMLAQFAGDAAAASEDSPASPPLFGSTDTDVRAIPETEEVPWRLVPIERCVAYTGVEPSSTSSSDPRMARVLSTQFDAVSSLFASAESGPDMMPPSDSRPSAPAPVRDPRRRPSDDKQRAASWMPQIA